MNNLNAMNSYRKKKFSLKNYFSRTKQSKEYLEESIFASSKELFESLKKITRRPSIPGAIHLARDIVGSGAWISSSYLKFLLTLSGMKPYSTSKLEEDDLHYIIDQVSKNIRIPEEQFTKQEIFQAIYSELDYAHHHPHYETKLAFPQIFPTIVLVSGVFNEIYKTAAFEKGVQYAAEKCGLKYIVADTHGFKGSKHNTKLIEDTLFEYHQQNPDEKFWIIAYSKGGIDSLHFLQKHSEWADKNVAGLSTIASPILGSPHLDSKLFGAIKYIQKFSPDEFSSYILKNKDIFKKDFMETLAKDNQEQWFRDNYHLLPDNCFYTSLALEAEWYESHLYMMALKLIIGSNKANDGVVDIESAFFPDYFKSTNLGVIKGHHLIGARSSTYAQECLIFTHIIYLKYRNLI